jgi:putative hemolysin
MEQEKFTVKFAETEQEKNSAYALRYNDMLKEYRQDIVCENGLDITDYDSYAMQAVCIDNEINQVVGCYRIISSTDIPNGKKFTCESEFDISDLKATGEKIVELSRAVVKKEYRNSKVLTLLFRFVFSYIREENFRFVIGGASFFGTDKSVFVKELSYLAQLHSIQDYQIKSLEEYQTEILPIESLDQMQVKRSLPALIRAYLSFGAKVSKDSFTDVEFGSVDVFILLDTKNYNQAYVNRLIGL